MPDTAQVTTNGDGAEAPAGLEGVVVAHTQIGDVRGLEGFYHYRQYDAIELNRRRTLEDVWHLMFRGHLPDAAEREAFRREIAAHRVLPGDLVPFLRLVAATEPFDPMTALRTAISFAAQRAGFRSWLDISAEQLYDNAMQISAQTPVLLAALYRLRGGQQPVPPDPELSVAGNYLYMLSGRAPGRAAGVGAGALPGLHDRPRVQRLHVHRPGDRVHRRRHRLGGDRRDRRPVRAAARRRAEPRAGDARRHRQPGPGRGLGPRRGRRAATGSWASATGSTRARTRAPR